MSGWLYGNSDMACRIRAHDWGTTPLGPIADWPHTLRTTVGLMLASGHAMQIAWGPNRIVLYNDAYAPMLGKRHPAALGLPFDKAWPDVWDEIKPLVDQVFRGETVRFDDMPLAMTRSGYPEETWWTFSYSPVRDDTGAVAGLLNVTVETTSKIRAEKAERARDEAHARVAADLMDVLQLQELSSEVIVEEDVGALYKSVIDTARGLMRSEMASIQRLVPERGQLFLLAHHGLAPDSARHWEWVSADHTSSCGVALASRQTTVVRDVEAWDLVQGTQDLAHFRLSGIRAILSTPLISRTGVLVGVISTHWSHVHEPSQREQRLLNVVARQAADLIERSASIAALRARERELTTMVEGLPAGVALIDTNGEVRVANAAFRRLAPRHVLDQSQLHVWKSWDADGRPLDPSEYPDARSLRGERVFPGIEMLYSAEGEPPVWKQVSSVPLTDERGHITGALSVITDIDALKRSQAVLRESEERQAFLLRLSDILRGQSDAEAVAQAAMNMTAAHLKLDRCFVATVSSSDNMAYVGPEFRRQDLPSISGEHSYSEVPEVMRLLQEAPVVISHTANDPQLPDSEKAKLLAYDLGAFISVPLRRGESDIVWGICTATKGPRTWTGAEKRLIAEVAERTWAAMERARAEVALRESEERLGLALDIGGLASWDWDMRTGEIAWNDRHYLMQGYAVGEIPPSYEAWVARVHPEDRAQTVELVERALTNKEIFVHEFRTRDPQGKVRWCSSQGRFFYDSSGKAYRMVGVMEDVTQRKHADAALRATEERFRKFAEASSNVLWIRDATSLDVSYVSGAAETVYGIAADKLLGSRRTWDALVIPDDRALMEQQLEQVQRGDAVVREFRIQRPSDGAFRWIRRTGFPLLSAKGKVEAVAGISSDVTEEKLAAEHKGVLLAELQHRVRNIMAVIRSIAARTATRAESVPEYGRLLQGRLLALARVQALLTRAANLHVNVRDVVQDEVSAQSQHEGQYVLEGPDVLLSPKTAELLTLAIHELSTNALKYGAFSNASGKVTVRWALIEKRGMRWLQFDWSEEGAPASEAPPAPARRGFGTELIEARIPYELGGTGHLHVDADGAKCHLEFPLVQGGSLLETGAPQRATVSGGALDMSGAPDLSGRHVLVVEDDYYLAADTARALEGAGATVIGVCSSEPAARIMFARTRPDAVILDINLGQGASFQFARILQKEGVPFVFLTGYENRFIPDEFKAIDRLEKPVQLRRVVDAVAALVSQPPSETRDT